jgi:hypothetical protein
MAARKLKINSKTNLSNKKSGGKTAEYLADLKVMGDEPTFTPDQEPTDLQYLKALQWYNVMFSRDSARKFVVEYLKTKGRLEDIAKFKQVPDCWTPVHMGWIARLSLRGVKLKQRSYIAFENMLDECFAKISVETKTVKTERVVVNIQDRIADKAGDLIAEVEGLIDDNGFDPKFSLYEWLKGKEASSAVIPHLHKHFDPILDELKLACSDKADKQLRDGYSKYTKPQLKQMLVYRQKMYADMLQFADNKKKQRAPRKKKEVTTDKKLKSFNYQKDSKDFRVVSLNPEKIFDAAELWHLNTRYKTITVLRADGGSLDVKGTTFINVNEATSKTYRLGRQAEKLVDDLNKSGKKNITKVIAGLKEAPLQLRSGENTILLKVF